MIRLWQYLAGQLPCERDAAVGVYRRLHSADPHNRSAGRGEAIAEIDV
jgi:hypothetical protein